MIKVVISEDRLTAFLTIDPVGQGFPSEAEIRGSIARAGVVYGIREDILGEVLRSKTPVESVAFAFGEPGEGRQDARLIWHIDLEDGYRPTFTENDRADYKHLHLFQQASQGQLLVEKTAPSDGLQGKGVTGEVLSGEGRDLRLPVGKNTYTSADGRQLFAEIEGFVFWNEEALHIDNIYHIRGNVDYNTGNVNFQGAVVVDGDVRSGFRVEASDDIFIAGTVGASSVYSQRGDITIKCGVVGKGRAKIIAGGNLHCGFVQDATVGIKGSAVIDHYAINSNISAGGAIRILENEGVVRGGSLTAGESIEVQEAGSGQEKYTQINLMSAESSDYHATVWDVQRREGEVANNLESLRRRVRFIEVLRDGGKDLSAELSGELRQLESEIERLTGDLQLLADRKKNLNSLNTEPEKGQVVKIHRTLHPNVLISFGLSEFYNRDLRREVTLSLEDGEIQVRTTAESDVEQV
ncbi:MAG: DUF342 domain-containing protein [Calditrichaeota bacterium]|nr:DUF342 domain-containing protein [Calditrichota bacterium]